MPTAQMRQVLRWLKLRPAAEIDCDHSADIGNREVWSANVFVVSEPSVDPGEKMLNTCASAIGERRDLFVRLGACQRASLESWRRISKRVHCCVEPVPLDTCRQGSNHRSFLRSPSHQWRIGMHLL